MAFLQLVGVGGVDIDQSIVVSQSHTCDVEIYGKRDSSDSVFQELSYSRTGYDLRGPVCRESLVGL